MKLEVTAAAASAIKEGLNINKASSAIVSLRVVRPHNSGVDHVKIVPVLVKQAEQPIASAKVAGIDFYVDFEDEWYFSGKQVLVDFQDGQLVYKFNWLTIASAPVSEDQSPHVSDATTSASQHFEELWD